MVKTALLSACLIGPTVHITIPETVQILLPTQEVKTTKCYIVKENGKQKIEICEVENDSQ